MTLEDALEILALYMPFRAAMNRNWKKITVTKRSIRKYMKEQEEMIHFMITRLRVSQKDPGALPFKLEGRQHVY